MDTFPGTASYCGSVANAGAPGVAHRVRIAVDTQQHITGTSHWPASPSLGLEARTFTLLGRSAANGRLEFADDAPECVPGSRRGIYAGRLNPVSGCLSGQYYEVNEQTHELFYWGDWTATRPPP